MKLNYEGRSQSYLTRRTPVVMRLDGRAFHTLTRHCQKPFDDQLADLMNETAIKVCEEAQGAKCAYVQSDEISILIIDYDRLTSDAWFNYNVQKMTSISASIASAWLNIIASQRLFSKVATFDSRVFNVPKEEVCNYFIWRQQDWTRNSLEMLARAHFSHKELHKKNTADIHEMLFQKGINWSELPDKWNGRFIVKTISDEKSEWKVLDKCPIFKTDKISVENFLTPKEI